MDSNKSKLKKQKQRRFAAGSAVPKAAQNADDNNINNTKDTKNAPNAAVLQAATDTTKDTAKPERRRRFHKSAEDTGADNQNNAEKDIVSGRLSRRAESDKGGRRSSDEYKYQEEREQIKKYHENKRKLFLGIFIGAVACIVLAGGYFVSTLISFPVIKKDDNSGKNTLVDTSMTSVSEDSVKLVLVYNGVETKVQTEASTVGELLAERDIDIDDDIHVSADMDDELYDTMEIVISEKIDVKVIKNGITQTVSTSYLTVEQVLEDAGIGYSDEDIVEPALDTIASPDMEIIYKDVTIEEVTVVETIPFEVEEGETNTVNAGLYAVPQEGVDGTAQITYEVKYIDGVEDSRTEISREVVIEPIPMIKLWGTAKPVKKDSDDEDGGSDSGSGDTSQYDEIEVSNPGQQATNPSIPAAPSSYIETMSGHVTAYTHTGSGTATGTQPRSTRTLDNPGTCAVVPSTIPYGSLLYVDGYGYCIAEDTGGFRHDPDRWNQIDLFMNTKDECYTWGRRDGVKVYILRKGY